MNDSVAINLGPCDSCRGSGDGPALKKDEKGNQMVGCHYAASKDTRKKFVLVPKLKSHKDCDFYKSKNK